MQKKEKKQAPGAQHSPPSVFLLMECYVSAFVGSFGPLSRPLVFFIFFFSFPRKIASRVQDALLGQYGVNGRDSSSRYLR